ncbi:hypothetical protein [uncultured Paludibaculum sp.]|uniref:hypothetical protein n=1 Tax=uncultured Paludibaculum sp. TaxID=1765020 RepID=UPI002AAC042B|nr:hypothetical protein [uncultured Paludibaculum sp.]
MELRPLSLGEILDRTFSLYRRQFLLFAGIAAIPNALVLLFELARIMFLPNPLADGAAMLRSPGGFAMWALSGLLSYVMASTAYTIALAGITFAVADLYLGRVASLSQSIRHVFSEFWSVMGILWLNGMAVGLGFVCLIIPGIYLACRLLVCLPAGLIERRGPGDSFSRSKLLTTEFAGRAFVILLLYAVVTYSLWIGLAVLIAAGPGLISEDPATMRLSTILFQLGAFLIGALSTPIFAISVSVFYFDLRVRKEALDLQLMLNPDSERSTPSDRGLSLLP